MHSPTTFHPFIDKRDRETERESSTSLLSCTFLHVSALPCLALHAIACLLLCLLSSIFLCCAMHAVHYFPAFRPVYNVHVDSGSRLWCVVHWPLHGLLVEFFRRESNLFENFLLRRSAYHSAAVMLPAAHHGHRIGACFSIFSFSFCLYAACASICVCYLCLSLFMKRSRAFKKPK